MNKSQQVLALSLFCGAVAAGVTYWFLPNAKWYGLALVFFFAAAGSWQHFLRMYADQATIERDDRESTKRRP